MSKDYERKVPALRNAHSGGDDSVAGRPSGSEYLTSSQIRSQRSSFSGGEQ
jgi:hypothetical protein